MSDEAAARVREHARALGAGAPGVGAVDPLRVASDAMDRHGVPVLRLVLASAALLIIYIDPSEPDRLVPLTYATLALYTAYSAGVFFFASVHSRPLPARHAHWIDVGWHTLLISMSSGTNSLFLFFYYFDILVASFRCGRREGLRVAAASAFLAASIGYMSLPAQFDLNRVLLRPFSLLVLGYMMAYWGGQEIQLTRRLALLREMTALRNPRFGVHGLISAALRTLRRFFDADTCLLVIADASDGAYWLYRARRGDGWADPERCDVEMAAMLMILPPTESVLFDTARRSFSRQPTVHRVDVVTRATSPAWSEALRVVTSTLEASALVTVPFRYHSQAVGRLYVVAPSGTFNISDLDFLSHAMETTLRVAENVRLVDRLASDAADVERRRIARGIHDTVIQPYIGLQLGLRAICERSKEGKRPVDQELEQFLSLIDAEVRRLRGYVTDLKSSPDEPVTFVAAVRRFARQFSAVTGIEVTVEGSADLPLTDRLAGELFEMTAEAFSNIRRHTTALRAAVRVEHAAGTIGLSITNETEGEAPCFSPRSVTERAESLGGTVRVHRASGTTRLQIAIPL